MRGFFGRISCSTVAVIFWCAGTASASDHADEFFETKIRPVLAETCFGCHGGKKTAHGLRVDTREALVRGGKTGPAIIPGNADASLLIQALRYKHAKISMPPDKPLPEPVVADFAAWVQSGAAWPSRAPTRFKTEKHWAFEPVKSATPPADPTGWADQPIDRFIAAGLRANHLHPNPRSEPRTLVRRLYFDLVGLPPEPEVVETFAADPSPQAYARLVDRLLASPRYGERWGRHWLDVVRYADTAGDNADYPLPEARLYRDYVIDAFNSDKPYDQFVREQLAGDLLARKGPPERYAEQVTATGFLALSRRYATAPYELWYLTLEDTIETTGRTFLGLTLRCARCHDHKFDPVTTEDYYALYGFFASTQFSWTGGEEFASKSFPRQHMVPLLPPEQAARKMAVYQQRLGELRQEIAQAPTADPLAKRAAARDKELQALAAVPVKDAAAELNRKAEQARLTRERDGARAALKKKIDGLTAELNRLERPGVPADLPVAYAVQDGQPVEVPIQKAGDPANPGPVAHRHVPGFLAHFGSFRLPAEGSGRLELARWLTAPENPLTARVMVNRLWQHHFGRGIVASPSNFGLRGAPPTHPELLDWLAAQFAARAWSVKEMQRQLVLSKTYQQSSGPDAACAARDPGNRWYWRYDRRRLDAEAIRDSWMAVGGTLDLNRPGPQPFPPIESWHWTQHNPFKEIYPSRHRSIYLMTQRFQRHPFLALFDGPDTNTSTAERSQSTVPQQALFVMNNPFLREQADGFARRLLAQCGDDSRRIDLAYRTAYARPPAPSEREKAAAYLAAVRGRLAQAAPANRERQAWASLTWVLLSANEFVYLDG